jgi:hypothetical protein
VGKQPFLHLKPHHAMRNQAWPLDEQQLHELGALLQQNKDADGTANNQADRNGSDY